jgi:hypothetical protein
MPTPTDGGRPAAPLKTLRGLLDRAGAAGAAQGEGAQPAEVCELCGVAIPHEHPHLVDVETRRLLCACRPCYLLFDHPASGAARFRAVPRRILLLPGLALGEAQWERMQIPVGIAFFFHHSRLGRTVAFYPSPAGATESLLGLDSWEEVARANPLVAALASDVEALLLYKHKASFEGFIVPISACYELVGRIRRSWKGFHGGEEAWREIDDFFAGLRERGVQPAGGGDHQGAGTAAPGAGHQAAGAAGDHGAVAAAGAGDPS